MQFPRAWPALFLVVGAIFSSLVEVSDAVVPDLAQCDDDMSSGHSASLLQMQARGGSFARGKTSPEGYYWTERAGGPSRNSTVPYSSVHDFSKGPSWIWDNENDEQVRHSPLIDDQKNIYVSSSYKIRKFNADGDLLWIWDSSGGYQSSSPSLSHGLIYSFANFDGHIRVSVLHMDTGKLHWSTNISGIGLVDSGTVLVTEGVCIVPTTRNNMGGANDMHALNATTGAHLWDYDLEATVWNFSPAADGKGSVLVAHSCGGAARISLQGKELWTVGPKVGTSMCSTGGGAVGSNGVYYTEHSKGHWQFQAIINAYLIETGEVLWTRTFAGYWGGQYPAVGPLGKDGRLALVIAIGTGPAILPAPIFMLPWLHKQYMRKHWVRKALLAPTWPAATLALDAKNGSTIWKWEEKGWDHWAARGDEDKNMVKRWREGSPEGAICLPDPQAIPVITGDGFVYSSSSHGGNLTVIFGDENGDGIIEPEETTAFAPRMAFLNSPSFAPHMLVAATCWGKVQVFKN